MIPFSAKVDPEWHLPSWRHNARAALLADVSPDAIAWQTSGQTALLAGESVLSLPPVRSAPRVPAPFLELADSVLCHNDPDRHAVLYRVLWRLTHGQRRLLGNGVDADIVRLRRWVQAVRRETQAMKGFVRFREITGDPPLFMAWFEPEYFVLDRVVAHFVRRFTHMHWAIFTPYRSVYWNGEQATFAAGGRPADLPSHDAQEHAWRIFYTNVFNPDRINPGLMRSHMPQRYWKTLPEAQTLSNLIGVTRRERDARDGDAIEWDDDLPSG